LHTNLCCTAYGVWGLSHTRYYNTMYFIYGLHNSNMQKLLKNM